MKNLSSQLTRWDLLLKLTQGSFWGQSVTSQWTHKMSSHCELSVSLQLTQWAHCYPLHAELTGMISRIAHSKLMVWVILWVHCEVSECPQNELHASFNMNSLWVSCELKFFTEFHFNSFLKNLQLVTRMSKNCYGVKQWCQWHLLVRLPFEGLLQYYSIFLFITTILQKSK